LFLDPGKLFRYKPEKINAHSVSGSIQKVAHKWKNIALNKKCEHGFAPFDIALHCDQV
jgi:hypothetical protein